MELLWNLVRALFFLQWTLENGMIICEHSLDVQTTEYEATNWLKL
jgi:hypothetical protein